MPTISRLRWVTGDALEKTARLPRQSTIPFDLLRKMTKKICLKGQTIASLPEYSVGPSLLAPPSHDCSLAGIKEAPAR
jgi:hypothetical protein